MGMHNRENPPALVEAMRAQNLSTDSPSIGADYMRAGWDAAMSQKMTKREAREVLGLWKDGRPVEEIGMDREQLTYKLALHRGMHADRITELEGAIEALRKRLKDHRKAKALANRRAEAAEKAMRDMLDTFKTGGIL